MDDNTTDSAYHKILIFFKKQHGVIWFLLNIRGDTRGGITVL